MRSKVFSIDFKSSFFIHPGSHPPPHYRERNLWKVSRSCVYRNFKLFALAAAAVLLLSSCGPRIITPSPSPERRPVPRTAPAPIQHGTAKPEPEAPQPRIVASMQLIDQAKTLLERNRPDAAISLLERAVSIYPANGLSFYYLAEAWFMKGNKDQAREFNRLAIRHFGKNSEWSTAVNEQKEKILNN